MPEWPTVDDVVDAAKLPLSALEDPALVAALAAGTAECRRLAPRRFTDDGPVTDDAWWAVCKAAALEYRGRGTDYGVGYPDAAVGGEPGGDGWQGVRRLLGIGFYAPPRVG
jgi:hypothetical protein